MNAAIRFENVSKRYSLGRRRAFLRELLPESMVHRITGDRDELWALKDVSFEVMPGEVFGIIGANGSGKTTALSLAAGVTAPTEGCYETRGSIGALIQLGAGFHPEFTGKENIYLNASILGIRKSQVDRIYRDVVEFAELGPFMDTPVKRYSSGMYARLGFSVAVHIDPDILLVDEVLAVGDMTFQTRCVQRMRELSRRGRSVIFVTHNISMAESLCGRILWLDHGRCASLGPAPDVIRNYLNEMDRQMLSAAPGTAQEPGQGPGAIQIERVVLRDHLGQEKAELLSGEPLTVELHFNAATEIAAPHFWIAIGGSYGTMFVASMLLDGERPEAVKGNGVLACTFHLPPLLPRVYNVQAGIRSADGATLLIVSRTLASFRVVADSRQLGLKGITAESMTRDSAPVLIPYEWRLPDGQVRTVNFRSGNNR